MTMPIDLVLVRHGESEGNVAVKASEGGDDRHFTEEYRNRHSSLWRLTDKGISQAQAASEFIKKYIGPQFDRQYMSHYLRAQETAYWLDLPSARWREDIFIRERNWGEFDRIPASEREAVHAVSAKEKDIDPFYWCPPNGESIADVVMRLKSTIIDTLHRECSDKRVIIVCHGEIMWAMRFLLEGLTVEQYHKLESLHDPVNRIRNCQVLWYTRRKESGELSEKLVRATSVCPWDSGVKKQLTTNSYPVEYSQGRGNVTTEQIGALLEQYPRIINDPVKE